MFANLDPSMNLNSSNIYKASLWVIVKLIGAGEGGHGTQYKMTVFPGYKQNIFQRKFGVNFIYVPRKLNTL